ncbi:hypothetical protein HanPI659440_Chr14g0528351 [Helianthus annuus]|nr:hypothetical protein HanPI659440_Chr14g0528351 [Helianthus annuus]
MAFTLKYSLLLTFLLLAFLFMRVVPYYGMRIFFNFPYIIKIQELFKNITTLKCANRIFGYTALATACLRNCNDSSPLLFLLLSFLLLILRLHTHSQRQW